MDFWLFSVLNDDGDDNDIYSAMELNISHGWSHFILTWTLISKYCCYPIWQMRKLQHRDRGGGWVFLKQTKMLPIKCIGKQKALLPLLKSKILGLVTLASDSVYIVKGTDDMAFIALIKTWVKSSRFILKWNCVSPAVVQSREQQRLLLRLRTIKEKRPFASISY